MGITLEEYIKKRIQAIKKLREELDGHRDATIWMTNEIELLENILESWHNQNR